MRWQRWRGRMRMRMRLRMRAGSRGRSKSRSKACPAPHRLGLQSAGHRLDITESLGHHLDIRSATDERRAESSVVRARDNRQQQRPATSCPLRGFHSRVFEGLHDRRR